ncbi:histidine kinase dimerization/phosphoacceptor domain -containing protein [Hymenobacter cellulosivorans]|uniref:histidine kinase n=1 Tax=Hymenobacter cellulosivorans TaxID=2932249 RepID=A0ABY4F6S7_9BACT|nr:histidine kinase dimerization/phosphoacceptor domain -containing protein [Hymenobacter cellulosivorans]UOQ52243.1 ATP-binding protein [Hymenobacter cellulosivorans]
MPYPVRRLPRLLLVFFLLAGFASQAEPLYPLLSRAATDSLRARLRQGLPDTNRVKALLTLSHDLISGHDELGLPLDSADAYARRALRLSNALGFAPGQISSQYALGRLLLSTGQPAAARGWLQPGLTRSRQLGARHLAADGWYYWATTYARNPDEMPERIRCFARAMQLYQNLGDRAQHAYVLKSIADMHLLQGNAAQARTELLQVVALYRAAGYRHLHYTYDLLRAVHRNTGNYKEALRYGLAAVESARATRDTALLPYFYTTVGTVYTGLNQLEQTLTYYRLALRQAHQEKNVSQILDIAGGIIYVLIAQHHPEQALKFYQQEIQAYPPTNEHQRYIVALALATCYTATGDFARAEHYKDQLVRALQVKKMYADDYPQQLDTYYRLGQLSVTSRQYAKARDFLRRAQAALPWANNVAIAAKLELLLFKVDSAETNYQAAIGHYQRYKALNDSIFNESKNKQLASLEVQYDTHKKEQNIALLTKQTQVQQVRLRQQEFQRNAFLVGGGLLIGLLGLGYNRYRLKQRSNRLLEAQRQEIDKQNQALQRLLREKDWMLKEIHHRVKNNLEVISSLLATQSDYLHDAGALAALREGQNRVHAMALIHQKLYQSASLSVVNMAAYIQDITEHLLESFDQQDTVQMELQVAPVELDVTLATPLGLILNEALTNALKYAFPAGQPGRITVALTEPSPQRYELTIADDGVGFPAGLDVEEHDTMGLTIMRGLSAQIDGTLHITHSPGVCISLRFAAVPVPGTAAVVSAVPA